jgi:thioredoxin
MSVIHADSDAFAKAIGGQLPVIVDFYADWCGPCRMLKPSFEKLSGTYDGKVVFLKVDVDKAGDIAGQFGVSSIPTVIMFKNGQPVDRFTGVMPEKSIDDFIKKNS